MSAIFIANIEDNNIEGIPKKIKYQACALSKMKKICKLLLKNNGHIIMYSYLEGELINKVILNDIQIKKPMKLDTRLYIEAMNLLNKEKYETLYVRHSLKPNFFLISLLAKAKKKKVGILYELPTYPYFGEQFNESNNKLKTSLRLGCELIFWPVIYIYITKLIVIVSNSKVYRFKKMHSITNGIYSKDILIKKKSGNNNYYNILGLGTIFKYHGYEKVLYSIKESEGKVNNKLIQFHIVGESDELKDLKELSIKLNIEKNLIFHGKKFGKELDEIFDEVDVAMGCLALYRRNADIDTTLKVVEYMVRGIPFVTSGIINNKNTTNMYLKIENNESPLQISKIYNFTESISEKKLLESAIISRNFYSWDSILSELAY